MKDKKYSILYLGKLLGRDIFGIFQTGMSNRRSSVGAVNIQHLVKLLQLTFEPKILLKNESKACLINRQWNNLLEVLPFQFDQLFQKASFIS